MIVNFKSIDKDGNITEFETEYNYENNVYSFEDKSTENTMIYVSFDSNSLSFIRKGDTIMNLDLIYKQKSSGYFKNNLGLRFEFETFTNDLSINFNKIYVSYSLFIENDLINEHKIWILFN